MPLFATQIIVYVHLSRGAAVPLSQAPVIVHDRTWSNAIVAISFRSADCTVHMLSHGPTAVCACGRLRLERHVCPDRSSRLMLPHIDPPTGYVPHLKFSTFACVIVCAFTCLRADRAISPPAGSAPLLAARISSPPLLAFVADLSSAEMASPDSRCDGAVRFTSPGLKDRLSRTMASQFCDTPPIGVRVCVCVCAYRDCLVLRASVSYVSCFQPRLRTR